MTKIILLPVLFLINLSILFGNFFLTIDYEISKNLYEFAASLNIEENFISKYNLGNIYFFKEDFENAEKNYLESLEKTPQDFKEDLFVINYNLGNTKFRQGQIKLFNSIDPVFLEKIEETTASEKEINETIALWESAIKFYEEALKNRDDQKTKDNIEFIKSLLEKLKKKQQQSQSNNNQNNNNQNQNQQNQDKIEKELQGDIERIEESEKIGKKSQQEHEYDYNYNYDPDEPRW